MPGQYVPTPSLDEIGDRWTNDNGSWVCKACGTVQHDDFPHGHHCETRMNKFPLNEATKADIECRFDYHAPDDDRRQRHEKLRASLKDMAIVVCELVPAGRERSVAIKALEDAMFWGNAGIARAGRYTPPPAPHGGPAADQGSTA